MVARAMVARAMVARAIGARAMGAKAMGVRAGEARAGEARVRTLAPSATKTIGMVGAVASMVGAKEAAVDADLKARVETFAEGFFSVQAQVHARSNAVGSPQRGHPGCQSQDPFSTTGVCP